MKDPWLLAEAIRAAHLVLYLERPLLVTKWPCIPAAKEVGKGLQHCPKGTVPKPGVLGQSLGMVSGLHPTQFPWVASSPALPINQFIIACVECSGWSYQRLLM